MEPPSSSPGHPTRPTQSRRRTGSMSSTSEHGSIHQSNGSSTLMPPDQGGRPRSSSSSKALLTKALLEAQLAVQLDNANEINAALEAYGRAVALLSKVMEVSSSPEEHDRLRTIHNSYLYRIHLLSQTAPLTMAAAAVQQQPRSPLLQASPQPPRQSPPSRSSGGQTSLAAAVTPASSSSAIAEDSEAVPISNRSTLATTAVATTPHQRRPKKPIPLQSSAASSTILPPSDPRMPRQRADSTSASEHSTSGHGKHHVRSYTGGSHRMAGDLIHTTDHGHLRASNKIRGRDHLGLPIHSAPTAPLPPTPSALGPPPSIPPPVPTQNHGSATSTSMPTHSHSNSNSSNMSGNYSFLASITSSPPPRSPLPPAPTSPPASPAIVSRRVSPLVPATSQQQIQPPAQQQAQQHAQQQAQQQTQQTQQGQQPAEPPKSIQSYPESSPEDENSTTTALSRFYDDDLISEEWIPNLSSSGYPTSQTALCHLNEDPYPRKRATSKGSFTGGQLEQIRSKAAPGTSAVLDEQMAEEPDRLSQQQELQLEQQELQPQQPQQQEEQDQQQPKRPQHQRSFSQSSAISTHQANASQSSSSSKSPLHPPMYNFQQGSSSITSLHALENTPSKRISDSSRSLKEGSPLARSSGGSGTTNGAGAAGSSSPLPSSPAPPQPQRPAVLQHQYSSSKLSTTMSNSNSSASSPTLDKSWSPSMNGQNLNQSSTGSATLFDVISDDPFAGMSFPLPPSSLEPPPSDPYLRCFWLMRRLEQTMTTGGFLTKRMYVPRAIWYQSLIRLPAADTKMNACQTLSNLLNKLTKQMQNGSLNLLVESGPEGDAERSTVLKELDGLETAARQVQSKLSKKLSFIHRPDKNGLNLTISTNQGYTEEMQGPVTGGNASVYGAASLYGSASHDWLGTEEPVPALPDNKASLLSSKKGTVSVGGSAPDSGTGLKSQWKSFSKSVQKSIGNDKVEDTSTYTEAVIRLFQSSYILESMLRHYNSQTPYQVPIVARLRHLCDVLNQVICAFVVRDLGELMGKYVKRVGAWVAE